MRRRCFLHHPLEPLFEHATESLTIALSQGSRRTYEATYRGFLRYLAAHHPDVRRLDQLRREPHVLGWLTQLRSRIPPMAKITISIRVVCLHRLFDHLAWSHQIVTLLRLLTREDVPRRAHSRQNRTNWFKRNSPIAKIWPVRFFFCSATPACVSVNAPTWPPTASIPSPRTSGFSMSRSESSTPSAGFRSMLLSVTSSK